MKKLPLITYTLGLCLLGVTSQAQEIFFDDFESDTVGAEPAGWDTVTGTDLITVQDTGAPFGSPNKYVRFADISTGGLSLFKQTTAINDILSTFSFDFYEPTGSANAVLSLGYTTATGDINASAALRLGLDDGTISFSSGEVTAGTKTYSLDTAYRFFLIVNDTAGPIGYTGPGGSSETLALNEYDVYFQQFGSSTITYAGTGVNDSTDSLGRFGYRTFSTGDQDFYLDNVLVAEGAVIPEPSTYGALLGSLALLVVLRRRRIG